MSTPRRLSFRGRGASLCPTTRHQRDMELPQGEPGVGTSHASEFWAAVERPNEPASGLIDMSR